MSNVGIILPNVEDIAETHYNYLCPIEIDERSERTILHLITKIAEAEPSSKH